MRTFLGTVLSVIAVGVMLIAYGLLSPRVAAAPYGVTTADPRFDTSYQFTRPMPVNDVVSFNDRAAYDRAAYDRYVAARPVAYPGAYRAPVRTTTTRVMRAAPKRDWQKTALVIGGSTAAGAGLGAIFGGKKGALIGAAIGGGASGLFEATRR